MKFGQEFQKALASDEFPAAWRQSAIEYKHLKKCIKKIHRELAEIGLSADTVRSLSDLEEQPEESGRHPNGYYSAAEPTLATVPEEFAPQLRVLVDIETGVPMDATLAPETRIALQRLAKHELVTTGRRNHVTGQIQPIEAEERQLSIVSETDVSSVLSSSTRNSKWIQVPLSSAKDFFELLEPKLVELEALGEAETRKLEEEIMDLGDNVENVVEPVREGYEATRSVSYRDLYFWREMFRLYMEKPIFYSETERRRGALTYKEAKSRLEEYDKQLQSTGLLAKLRTPLARKTAQQFLDLNVEILKIMHFQEMNAKAMTKILKKFDKRTNLDGEGQLFLQGMRSKHPALLTPNKDGKLAGSFANSIARDLNAEIATKVLAIVPQLDDWICPVCYSMAWRPVNLGCCRSVFCIRCIIKLQEEGMKRCPVCNRETVMSADGRNIDFETMDFLEKFFPMEVRKAQKANERAALIREYGEEFVKPSCSLM